MSTTPTEKNRQYKHVRSSGYLTPNYRYRNPPPKMSWLEENIDLDDMEGNKRSQSPEPQLDDFINKILQIKRVPITIQKETAYRNAVYLASSILEAAFDLEWLYSKYIKTSRGRPEISDFRAIDKNVYVCLVPLRKSVKPSSFKVPFSSPSDLPNHRMLLVINENLTKEERLDVIDEWGHCLDSKGIVRPDFVLQWFNQGIIKVCEMIEVENKRTQKFAFMETSLADDGTVWVHIVGLDPEQNYKINILPCVPIREIPKQLNLNAPIPSTRPHNQEHGKFLREVHEAVGSGKRIVFLEARLEKWSAKYCKYLQISWGMHIGQLEDRAFAFLNSLTPTKVFEDIIILINAMKEDHTFCLHAVSNKVINHAMFYQFRKNLGKFTQTQEWLMAVLETIKRHMKLKVFPNFFLSKQNIIMEPSEEVLKFNEKELKRLISNLKTDPTTICLYTGCEEKMKKEGDKIDENIKEEDEKTDENSNENSETSESDEKSDKNLTDENEVNESEDTNGKSSVHFVE